MNPEEPTATRRSLFGRIARPLFWSLVVLFFVGVTGSEILIEAPFHFSLGWMLHAKRTLPPLLVQWPSLLPPLACLVIAGFMAHRFVLWWLRTRGDAMRWKPAQTITALAILLLASAAAIAMSGIVHQSAWLANEPWHENRGRNIAQTIAVSNARQLTLLLSDYHDSHGRYPDKLQQLDLDSSILNKLIWVEPAHGEPAEPFILLKPGQPGSNHANEPLVASPVIRSTGKVAVGYADTSVRSVMEHQFLKLLDGTHSKTSPAIPPPHE